MNSFKETYDKILDKAKKINKWCYILAVIAFLFLCTSIYFSQNSHAYQNEAQDLNEQIAELNATYEELDTEYQNYVQDSESDIKLLNATIEEQQSISDEYDKLSEEHAKCQETINGLNSQITELQAQVQNLNSQLDTLKAENASASASNDNASNSESSDSSNAEDTSNSATAWLSATGSKYHSIPNCGRMNPNKARQTTVSAAQSMGYDACSKCW